MWQMIFHRPDRRKVFVVHGRNEKLRSDFFGFLRALRLNPLEWSHAINLTGKASPYIGEALDAAFKNAQAVVVLLSPDDEVRLTEALWAPVRKTKKRRLGARHDQMYCLRLEWRWEGTQTVPC